MARVTGKDHREALIQMIESRYRLPPNDYARSLCLEQLDPDNGDDDNDGGVADHHKHDVHHRGPPARRFDALAKFWDDIESSIAKYRRKYPNVEL